MLEPIYGHECTFQKLDTQFHVEWQGHLHLGQGQMGDRHPLCGARRLWNN